MAYEPPQGPLRPISEAVPGNQQEVGPAGPRSDCRRSYSARHNRLRYGVTPAWLDEPTTTHQHSRTFRRRHEVLREMHAAFRRRLLLQAYHRVGLPGDD